MRQVLFPAQKDGNDKVPFDHNEQALTVAGVETRVPFTELCNVLGDQFKVSERPFQTPRFIWKNRQTPSLTSDIFFRKGGRPKKYTVEFDKAFMNWLKCLDHFVVLLKRKFFQITVFN